MNVDGLRKFRLTMKEKKKEDNTKKLEIIHT